MTIGQALYSEYMIRLRAGDKKNGILGLAIEDEPVEETRGGPGPGLLRVLRRPKGTNHHRAGRGANLKPSDS